MCEFSGRLVAWLDRELSEAEATNVGWHVAHCSECRSAVQSFEQVSRAFLPCYERTVSQAARRPRWVYVASGTAAAAAILAAILFWPRPAERLPLPAIQAARPPAMAFVRPSGLVLAAVQAQRVRVPKPIQSVWAPPEPIVEVELPAEILFPPGAVPEGFRFIADVRTEP